MPYTRIALAGLALGLGAVVAPPASAQNWPAKPVRIIAVFPAGGSVDQVARILAQPQTGDDFPGPPHPENRQRLSTA